MIKAKSEIYLLGARGSKFRRSGSDAKLFAKERLIENADSKNADWGELGDIVQCSRAARQKPKRANSDEKLFTKERSQNADRGEISDIVQRSRAAKQAPRRANSDEKLFAKMRLQNADRAELGDIVERSRAARRQPRRTNSDEKLFTKLRLQNAKREDISSIAERSRAAREPPRRASSDEKLFAKERSRNAKREDISSIAERSRAAWKPRRRASCDDNLCAREGLEENEDRKNADWRAIGDSSQSLQTTKKPPMNVRELMIKAKSERYLGHAIGDSSQPSQTTGNPPVNRRKLMIKAKSEMYLDAKGSRFRRAGSDEKLLHARQRPSENTSKRNFDWGEISAIAPYQPLDKTTCNGPVPSMPKRLLSPLGRKVLLKNSFRHIKLPDEDEMSDSCCDSDCESLEEATEAPSQIPPLSGSKQDLRAAILDRIPSHIKEQLSLNEWNKILEPAAAASKQNEAADEDDDCSDILHGFADIPSPNSRRKQKLSAPQKRDKAFDALYCTENGSRAESPKQRPRMKEGSKMEGPPKRTSVSFGEVQVRSYERILEVHPCTSAGPSLGIGWDYTESSESIDWSNSSSDRDNIRLSRDLRERMVKELGYSSRDVAYAVREGLRIKNQRRRTINNLKASIVNIEKVEFMAEKCNRKLKKLQAKFILAGAA